MVAGAVLWSFLLDNTDKAWFALDVDVPDRRRGVGRALLERIEQVAKDDGRALLLDRRQAPLRRARDARLPAVRRGLRLPARPTTRWSAT